ncbi:DUF6817 domain-containing protein [Couchioplanes caeruleus]|uniref:DUF6817 domain-containing protein n=2 Tax=Couchioplanes caeruleus TaxID=56438 RepID=A0A1K0FFB8_9ACTN|nr:hypothetical protein [Couchioplanes caeruleus]OJF11529.1 hypothetical protein BG844_25780 [Couchioplanes caeruleus subsp. caeruleus]ROP27586.1 hypothetical protein EDD30_0271 [Couchioplanes caeruleus]
MTTGDVKFWLRERGTETIDHPGGTLYAHLGRVHDRLAGFGHGPDVCLAGLAHAVYGTDGFDLTLLDPGDRAPLRHLVGERAEALVYLYGACDRSRTWKVLPENRQVWNRWTGVAAPLPDDLATGFADLSIVNELDVAEHDASVAQKHGPYFRSVFTTWQGLASEPVLAEASRVFAA